MEKKGIRTRNAILILILSPDPTMMGTYKSKVAKDLTLKIF